MISSVFVQRIDWNGTTVEVSYDPHWLGMPAIYGEPVAHLELRSLEPEDAALPVTETGYRSHFLPASEVLDHGGPIAFARTWLDEAAQSKAWIERQERSRQLSFFS